MNELNHRSKGVPMRVQIFQCAAEQQQQSRAQALSPRRDDVLSDFAHQRNLGVQSVAYHLIDPLHVRLNQVQRVVCDECGGCQDALGRLPVVGLFVERIIGTLPSTPVG